MNRKFKLFIKLVIFILSIVVSIALIMVDLIILFKYTDHYIIDSNIRQSYLKYSLLNEIGIAVPNEAKITKIEFQRVYDASIYNVTYVENGEEKTEEKFIDSDGIKLDQYMKKYGRTNNNLVFSLILFIVIIQILIPVICLRLLIKEVKNNKKEKKKYEKK